jgi:hypothetical protein
MYKIENIIALGTQFKEKMRNYNSKIQHER